MADADPPVDVPAAHPFAQALIDAHAQIAPKQADAQYAHTQRVLEEIERDLGPYVAPLLDKLIAQGTIPEELRAMLTAAAHPDQLGGSLLVGVVIGAILAPVLGAATAPYVQSIANQAWQAPGAGTVPLSPAEAAVALLKHNPYVADPYTDAHQSGVGHDTLDAMEYNIGRPPALGDLLLLFRREQIDRARLLTGIRQSDLRDEWEPEILDLKYTPPPAGEVVAGLLKHHLTQAEAVAKLGHAGIDPVELPWMLATAGRPLGLEQMVEFRNRTDAGLANVPVTETDVQNALAQSDINNDYAKWTPNLGVYLPPVRSILPMLRSGAIDTAHATQLFKAQGVRQVDIDGYLAEAAHGRTQTVRELSQSQVVRMYTTQLIDQPTALAKLEALRYTPADAQLLLTFADDARHEQLLNATIRSVGTRYVAHKLPKADATHALTLAAVPNAAQLTLFTLWDIERTANVHAPTPATVIGAYRRGEIGAAETKTRLLDLGIAQGDLALFVADGWPPTKGTEARSAAQAVVNA